MPRETYNNRTRIIAQPLRDKMMWVLDLQSVFSWSKDSLASGGRVGCRFPLHDEKFDGKNRQTRILPWCRVICLTWFKTRRLPLKDGLISMKNGLVKCGALRVSNPKQVLRLAYWTQILFSFVVTEKIGVQVNNYLGISCCKRKKNWCIR